MTSNYASQQQLPYPSIHSKPYLVQGQEGIQFDEAMEVSEEDLDWDEFNVLRMVIEMWPELDGFGEEEPSDKEVHSIERLHVGQFRRYSSD